MMMRWIITIMVTVSITGCAVKSKEIDALNEIQTVGNPFTKALTKEYRDYANYEQDVMHDYADSIHFGRKGLAAAKGEEVLPEPVEDWNIPQEYLGEISLARSRLMTVLDIGARQIAPKEAASTQLYFDCWVEQQEESWSNIEEITKCKNGFMSGLKKLEQAVNFQPHNAPAPAYHNIPPPVADPVFPRPVTRIEQPAAQPLQVENANYLVFFDFDSAYVGPNSQKVITSVVEEMRRNPNMQLVNVVGHADTIGSGLYNQGLGLKRAEAVKRTLMSYGIAGDRIHVRSMGESELLVPTADNTREPSNRRANITFGRPN